MTIADTPTQRSCPTRRGPTTARFLERALDHFASVGMTVEQLLSDNHLSYSRSRDVADVVAIWGVKHVFIKPHCPWQNGKVERFTKTPSARIGPTATPFKSNRQRADALAPWLDFYNTRRQHTALGGQPPISRVPPTS